MGLAVILRLPNPSDKQDLFNAAVLCDGQPDDHASAGAVICGVNAVSEQCEHFC